MAPKLLTWNSHCDHASIWQQENRQSLDYKILLLFPSVMSVSTFPFKVNLLPLAPRSPTADSVERLTRTLFMQYLEQVIRA